MAADPCQCESLHHFPASDLEPHLAGHPSAGTGHHYLDVPAAPGRVAHHVGPICEECALTHMATYLIRQTRTVVVRNRIYDVIDEPRINGEIAPHLYRRPTGMYAGVVIELPGGITWITGAPPSWTASDIRDAVNQILATLP